MATAVIAPGEDLAAFVAKWRGHWPEWQVAETFVPQPQRAPAVAWYALREELAEAAWGFADPRPGDAKLGWWAEELQGWQQGRRRHPLGQVLQPMTAPWATLATCLPALQAARTLPGDVEQAIGLLEHYAEAVAGVAQSLFACERPAPARGVVLAQLAERAVLLSRLGQADAAFAGMLHSGWGAVADGSVAGRLHAALLRARLRRLADGQAGPLPAWQVLPLAWRAARG